MNKKILALFLAFATIISLSACKSGEETPSKEEEVSSQASEVSSNDLGKKIAEANSMDSLKAKYERAAAKMVYTTKQGDKLEYYSYFDKDRFILVDNSTVNIEDNGTFYSYDTDTGELHYLYYLEDTKEEYWDVNKNLMNYRYEEESYSDIKTEEKDENIYYTLYYKIDPLYLGDIESLGISLDEIAEAKDETVVDKETLEIKEGRSVITDKDGKEYVVAEIKRVSDPEEFKIPNEIMEKITEGEKRNIKVIVDADSDKEYTIEITGIKGIPVYLVMPDNMDTAFYKDPEYTEIVSYMDLYRDNVSYIRHIG